MITFPAPIFPAWADPPVRCVDPKLREHIRQLMLDANDEAFKAHVGKLFSIWLKEYGPDASRARSGMLNGINAYERGVDAAQQWNPPLCKE